MSGEDEYRKLSSSEIKSGLSGLRKWKLLKGKLHREIDFKNFEDAISFMVRTSLEIEKLDHHPEWFNVYNHVTIDLTTHDVNGISNYDFILARKIDTVAKSLGR
jgi:4a-hydroxytetrahydrobiopterin dehydratase